MYNIPATNPNKIVLTKINPNCLFDILDQSLLIVSKLKYPKIIIHIKNIILVKRLLN